MIIAINGKISSGKDTVGKMIQYLTSNHGKNKTRTFEECRTKIYDNGAGYADYGRYSSDWEIKKFAFKLKQIVSILTGVTVSDLEREQIKSSSMPSCWNKNGEPVTYRQALQWVGTEGIRNSLHENAWVNALFADYNKVGFPQEPLESICDKTYPKWIITDTRFKNEAEAVHALNGIVIRVVRPSLESTSNHPSETSLDDYGFFNYQIVNDGSLDDLEEKVKVMLEKFNII